MYTAQHIIILAKGDHNKNALTKTEDRTTELAQLAIWKTDDSHRLLCLFCCACGYL